MRESRVREGAGAAGPWHGCAVFCALLLWPLSFSLMQFKKKKCFILLKNKERKKVPGTRRPKRRLGSFIQTTKKKAGVNIRDKKERTKTKKQTKQTLNTAPLCVCD